MAANDRCHITIINLLVHYFLNSYDVKAFCMFSGIPVIGMSFIKYTCSIYNMNIVK